RGSDFIVFPIQLQRDTFKRNLAVSYNDKVSECLFIVGGLAFDANEYLAHPLDFIKDDVLTPSDLSVCFHQHFEEIQLTVCLELFNLDGFLVVLDVNAEPEV